ncbi:hypothetical protein [Halorarius halobius]|uniref:hypothetical protein n=1 Tax=Halorarius halobius TaxID=2962671 RepID=UPI0020CC6C1A|nr:hypothetical protein [Halorarius halobius]
MSLPAFAAATAVTTVLAHGLMRLLGRRYGSSDRASRRLRRDLLVGSVLSLVGWLVAVVAADGSVHPAVANLLAGPEFARTLLTAYGYALAGTAVVLGTYLGYLPAIRRTREVELGTGTAAVRVARWLVVAALFAATAAAAAFSVSLTPLTAAVGVALVAAGAYLAAPWLIALTQSVREPTDEERARIDSLLDRADADGYRLRVLDRREEENASAFVRGPPGYRHLFVTDYLLDALDDDDAAAMLAVTTANARHTAYRLGLVAVGGGLLLATLSAGRPLVGVGLLVAVPTVGYPVGRRLVFHADDRAADAVGAGRVADALDTVAQLHDASLDAGLLARVLSLRPSVGQRIDRLRAD